MLNIGHCPVRSAPVAFQDQQGGHVMSRLAAVLVLALASLVVAGSSGATIGPVSSSVLLHSFSGPEGETPAAPLVQGTDGFFYAVAAHRGDFTVLPPAA